jgi:uncharacterized protein YndB with AHSA1/START domain
LIAHEGEVLVERRIAAAPETVFSFITEPAKFVTWMGVGAEPDPRPGGRYRIDAGSGNMAVGEYREVEPPRRLVFSWGWEHSPEVPPGSTTVEITLTADGSATLLRLRHLGLPTGESRRSHGDGWKHFTDQLASLFD